MTERTAYETMTDFIHSFRFLPAPSPPQLNPFPKLFICPPLPPDYASDFPHPPVLENAFASQKVESGH